jgi:hypothetical protein
MSQFRMMIVALGAAVAAGALADGQNAVSDSEVTAPGAIGVQAWAGFTREGADYWLGLLYGIAPAWEAGVAFGSSLPGTYDARFNILHLRRQFQALEGARTGMALEAGLSMNGGSLDDWYLVAPISWQATNRLVTHLNLGYRYHRTEPNERGATFGVRGDLQLAGTTELLSQLSLQPGLPALVQVGPRLHLQGGRSTLDFTFGQELTRGRGSALWVAFATEF